MTQFNAFTDARLESLDATLAQVIPEQKALQEIFDSTWRAINDTFDTVVGAGVPARFLAASGHTLARQITDPEPRLDPALLQQFLATVDGGAWDAISDPGPRVLNQFKLEAAIKKGAIPADIVQRAIVKPKGVTSRHRRSASAEDCAWAAEQARRAETA